MSGISVFHVMALEDLQYRVIWTNHHALIVIGSWHLIHFHYSEKSGQDICFPYIKESHRVLEQHKGEQMIVSDY